MNEPAYHIPALLIPCMEGLNIQPDGTYIDVTFGGGGHSREILSRLGKNGRLVSFDQDADAQRNIIDDDRFTFVCSNFKYLANFADYHELNGADGILADLGVSFHHFDDETRGFSFRFNADLDMRMNTKARLSAADVVNNYTEAQLADILFLYGELKNARKIANVLVKNREKQAILTTNDLLAVVEPLLPQDRQKKEMTKVFQALRIEVNHEMDALKRMLEQTTEVLKPGGRLVVLTYHSLEDRLVKNFMKTGNCEGKMEQDFFGNRLTPFNLVNNKVIVASEEEVEANPRSRSAKLRIAEFVGAKDSSK
ncbi:MAG: 16S rRNA (cytosine(1402)-N(4))-methyltransferase RsmH [Paludibacteraceae bacterium]|nr:16S rRNA (cytosine(1402)-N(4))-methyltransferase RsmH [Paludibacteraceae bacterium]